MTAPDETAGVDEETEVPPATPEDEGVMLQVLIAAILAYLAARTVVKGPWRNVAAVLDIAAVGGAALGLLARRTLTAQAKNLTRELRDELWKHHDQAAGVAVEAGIELLVRTIFAVQDRMIAQADGTSTPPAGGTPRDAKDGPSATEAAPGGTTTARRAPQPGTPEAAKLQPRDILSDAQLGNIAVDLVDTVMHTAATTAAALTKNWDKTWLSKTDNRVRSSHRLLHGTTIQVLDSFTTPEGTIRYPHDLQAPASLTINCRCRLRFTYRRKADRARTAALVPPDQLVDGDDADPDPDAAARVVRVGSDR